MGPCRAFSLLCGARLRAHPKRDLGLVSAASRDLPRHQRRPAAGEDHTPQRLGLVQHTTGVWDIRVWGVGGTSDMCSPTGEEWQTAWMVSLLQAEAEPKHPRVREPADSQPAAPRRGDPPTVPRNKSRRQRATSQTRRTADQEAGDRQPQMGLIHHQQLPSSGTHQNRSHAPPTPHTGRLAPSQPA